jgi:hypothetical protein
VKEHFKPFGIGWFIIYLIIFVIVMIMTALSYWDIFTDRQIGYVWCLFLAIAMVEGFLGLTVEYKDAD